MPGEETINAYISEALEKLDLALSEAIELSRSDNENLYQLGKLGRSIGLIREFQIPIFEKRPDLKPPPPWEGRPEPCLTEEEERRISYLTTQQIEVIDESLLSYATSQYQKIAKIVAMFMNESSLHETGVPDLFYAQRIELLSNQGRLEYQGNPKFMQFCEVRAPKT